ncbi:DUF6348 family protein [Tepidamorphus sp. 3E244]|uniref:DUF6348 family protein n=1 Tax=Tepidamorphus sp. 3E244 TaxID=3385498 RepID=UPI0038FBE662
MDEMLADFMRKLFAEYGLQAEEKAGWVLPDGVFPALRAHWLESDTGNGIGTLTVEATLSGGEIIEETYAGVGTETTGCMDALKNFVAGPFHVLLSGLWDVQTPEVDRSICDFDAGRFILHSTEPVYRGPAQGADIAPPGALELLEEALIRKELSEQEHWVSAIHCNTGKGEAHTHAILDNQPWPEGSEAFAAAGWQETPYFYTVRGFLLFTPETAADADLEDEA